MRHPAGVAFDRDDLVSLMVFDHFVTVLKGDATLAGRVAQAVLSALRQSETVEYLWIVSTSSGIPRRVVSERPPADLISHCVNVRVMRREITARVAERLAEK